METIINPSHDIPDLLLSGKVCLVTGATSGIGEVTAHLLARLGARVVIASRSQERCQAVAGRITRENEDWPGAGCADFLVADLSEMSAVKHLADQFLSRYDRLDVLINNVGAMYDTRHITSEGWEKTWALNHLGYFLLTACLMERLKETAARWNEARIINVSSAAHRGSKINFDDLQGERFYNPWRAYAQSKLANILFTFELDRRLRGTDVTANALHPGFVATQFGTNNSRIWKFVLGIIHRFAITPEEGAATSIFLASSPEALKKSGLYFVNSRPTAADPAAYDIRTARQLWVVSEEMLFDYLR